MLTGELLATVIVNVLWVLQLSSLTSASETDVNCLRTIRTQLKDPNGYLTNWVFDDETTGFICGFAGVDCWHDNDRVLSIKLTGFGLEGEFPRGIKECSSLTALDLSNNNLSSTLPSDISTLIRFVTTLDLSYNGFSGEIPVNLANMSFLNTLMLNNNRFTGHLPPQLASLGRLKQISVANNLLTGPVPNFNSTSITRLSYENNLGLCGSPLDPCKASSFQPNLTAAMVGAAIFAPIGAGIGWFCFDKKDKQRGRRRQNRNTPT